MKRKRTPQITIAIYQAIVSDFERTGDSEHALVKRHKVSSGQVDRILNRYLNSKQNAIVRNQIQ